MIVALVSGRRPLCTVSVKSGKAKGQSCSVPAYVLINKDPYCRLHAGQRVLALAIAKRVV